MSGVVDEPDFDEVVLPFLARVAGLARSLTSDRMEAADLVQDTVVRALVAWRAGTRPDDPPAWLATICLNAARSSYRRHTVRRGEVLTAQPPPRIAATDDVEAQVLARLDADAVHDALGKLQPHYRDAIVLMDLCGLTAAQTAAVLDAPRGTILSRVHRGRKALAVLLTTAVAGS